MKSIKDQTNMMTHIYILARGTTSYQVAHSVRIWIGICFFFYSTLYSFGIAIATSISIKKKKEANTIYLLHLKITSKELDI